MRVRYPLVLLFGWLISVPIATAQGAGTASASSSAAYAIEEGRSIPLALPPAFSGRNPEKRRLAIFVALMRGTGQVLHFRDESMELVSSGGNILRYALPDASPDQCMTEAVFLLAIRIDEEQRRSQTVIECAGGVEALISWSPVRRSSVQLHRDGNVREIAYEPGPQFDAAVNAWWGHYSGGSAALAAQQAPPTPPAYTRPAPAYTPPPPRPDVTPPPSPPQRHRNCIDDIVRETVAGGWTYVRKLEGSVSTKWALSVQRTPGREFLMIAAGSNDIGSLEVKVDGWLGDVRVTGTVYSDLEMREHGCNIAFVKDEARGSFANGGPNVYVDTISTNGSFLVGVSLHVFER